MTEEEYYKHQMEQLELKRKDKHPVRKHRSSVRLYSDVRQQEQRQDEVIWLQSDFINNVYNNYQP